MKAIIILNPNAHSGETSQRATSIQDEISIRLKDTLHVESVEWCQTLHTGHGTQLAADAVRDNFDYIFAGGGDGTINEVLNGIMSTALVQNQRPVMGVLPFGTSNDFFAALKTTEATYQADKSSSLTLRIDIGYVKFDDVERYFCLTTGMGLVSWANEQYLDASQTFGRRFAHIPAAISTILTYRFLPNVKISLNGKRAQARRILSVVVDNSPVIAGGTALTPEARIDDGQLDVCIFKPVSLLRLIWLMLEVSRTTHTRSRAVILGRIYEMDVIAKQLLPIHVDGELVPEIESKAYHMMVKILPHALNVVIPSLCELPSPTPIP